MSTSNKGFTIIELIVIIAVIGILTLITVIGFTGARTNGKTQQANANANVIQKKIDAYNSAKGTFPADTTYTNYLASLNTLPESTLTSSTISWTWGTPSSSAQTNIEIAQCNAPSSTYTANGMAYRIRFWDYTTNAVSTTILTRSLVIGTACSGWAPLS